MADISFDDFVDQQIAEARASTVNGLASKTQRLDKAS